MQHPWNQPRMQLQPTIIIVQLVIVPLLNANPPPIALSYQETV